MAHNGSLLVADGRLLSLDNIGELTAMADQGGRRLEFILAVPARRYSDLVETFQAFDFGEPDGLAEARFAGHRLIVAHDALRAHEQRDKRRTHALHQGGLPRRAFQSGPE